MESVSSSGGRHINSIASCLIASTMWNWRGESRNVIRNSRDRPRLNSNVDWSIVRVLSWKRLGVCAVSFSIATDHMSLYVLTQCWMMRMSRWCVKCLYDCCKDCMILIDCVVKILWQHELSCHVHHSTLTMWGISSWVTLHQLIQML